MITVTMDRKALKVSLLLVAATFYVMTSSTLKSTTGGRGRGRDNGPARLHPKRFYSNSLHRDTRMNLESRDCHMMHTSNSCHVLPNFFTHPESQPEYAKKPILDFVHLAKTGGDTMRLCLRTLAEKQGLRKPLVVDSNSCSDIRNLMDRSIHNIQDIDIIHGHKANGICEMMNGGGDSSRKCSTFTIFRDPFARMTSHYFYLRQRAESEEMRDNKHAHASLRLPIEQWAIEIGSETRNKFFSSMELLCSANGSEFCERKLESFSTFEEEGFVEDIVDNLHRHFSAVGLTSQYSTTLRILQRVYGLPFYDVCNDLQLNKGVYDNKTALSMRKLKSAAMARLRENERVKSLLRLDVAIFERAKELFQIQVGRMNAAG